MSDRTGLSDPRYTADVVVLGTGPAGMAAVAAARASWTDVLAVEALDHIGGNAVFSTGYLAFVDSYMQRELGIRDDEATFTTDAQRIVEQIQDEFGIVCDDRLISRFARESAETYRILYERGVRFSRFIPRPEQHSVDRMAAVEDTWMFRKAFRADFSSSQVTCLFNTSARSLVTEAGNVVGAVVRSPEGEEFWVRARRGVILTTGGYQANPLMRQRYQPEFIARGPYLGVDTCRGDGHLMGQAAGGDLINMTLVPPLVIVSSSVVEDAIAVNDTGARFHDEAGPYGRRVTSLLAQPGRRAHYIFDNTVAAEKAELIKQMPEPAVSAPTLAELAACIGVEAETLRSTVARWNGFLDSGNKRDPDFGRVVLPPERRHCENPPYWAVPMVVGVNFCCGGFRVTDDMQVIDVYGHPIPGLFAAGDCVGGFNPVADLGGIHICGAFTFGRIAGTAAANGTHSETRRPTVQGAHLPSNVDRSVALVHLATES